MSLVAVDEIDRDFHSRLAVIVAVLEEEEILAGEP
jgi:hypothetical protein